MTIDFPSAFSALTGHKPFRWQQRLFDEMVAAVRYDACDIPTGLGKTSIIPIWLLALAAQTVAGQPILPRRLVYVVNRRTVVDQATDVAVKLRDVLRDPAPGNPATAAREALRGLCIDPD